MGALCGHLEACCLACLFLFFVGFYFFLYSLYGLDSPKINSTMDLWGCQGSSEVIITNVFTREAPYLHSHSPSSQHLVKNQINDKLNSITPPSPPPKCFRKQTRVFDTGIHRTLQIARLFFFFFEASWQSVVYVLSWRLCANRDCCVSLF